MPEVTDNYVRVPVGGGVKEGEEVRTIDVDSGEGIKALYAVNAKEIRTYLFAIDKGWTMGKAKEWIEKHKDESTVEAVKSLVLQELSSIRNEIKRIVEPK